MAEVVDSGEGCKLLYHGQGQGDSGALLLRSRLLSIAQRLGFAATTGESMVLVAAEMASNQAKYAGGRGFIQVWQQPGPVLDILALDYGPGIEDPEGAKVDGFSSRNTLGKGLGSIQRLSDESHLYTRCADRDGVRRWTGAAVMARFRSPRSGRGALLADRVGLFSRSLEDERYSGDRIYLRRNGGQLQWLHLDGLGHGDTAYQTTADLAGYLGWRGEPQETLLAIDRQLVATRGAVAILGEVDGAARAVSLLGVGDMHAHLFGTALDEESTVAFAPGVLGREHKQPTRFDSRFARRGVVITASDGIRRNWDGSSFPGLFEHHPQLIAYVVGNIMARMSDDQSLCVVGVDPDKKNNEGG